LPKIAFIGFIFRYAYAIFLVCMANLSVSQNITIKNAQKVVFWYYFYEK